MMYICFLLSSFGALYSGQTFCIYMGCTDIGYCAYGICSIWTAFMVMYLWLCVWMCLWTCIYRLVFLDVFMVMCLWVCVYGFVWAYFWMYGCVFMAMGLWLCVWVSGLDPSRGPVHQISALTSPWGPFWRFLGLTPP